MTWPSTFSAGTLGYMKDRIDDELMRGGSITSQINQCITDAITTYQKHRFRFSDATFTFNTVIGQEFYTSIDNASIQNLYLIDYLALQIGTARFDLVRRTPEAIDLLTQSGTQQGQPQVYSYFNEQIRFYPVPSAVYPIICSSHAFIPAPAGDSVTGNRWMLDGERLIRSRAKWELATNYLKDVDMAAAMNGAVDDAYSELKGEANKITGIGRVTPSQF